MSDGLIIGALFGWIVGSIIFILLLKTGWMAKTADWILGEESP